MNKRATLLLLGALLSARVFAADFAVGERLAPASPPAEKSDVQEIKWEALVPAGWNPVSRLKDLNLADMKDSDPRAIEALAQLRAELDSAPVVPALDGTRVKIPGFVVMLERRMEGVIEFLLVPYYGACIHVPPPPSNQIIHVLAEKPVPDQVAMYPVWVTGTLRTVRANTSLGAAGYRIQGAKVAPYPRQPQVGKKR